MSEVMPVLFALAAAFDITALSAAEIESLATSGRSPEAIHQQERLMGYQKRLPDGSILHIMRPSDDDDYL